VARATRTIDPTGLSVLDRQRADLAERELKLLSREATVRNRERELVSSLEEIASTRNDLYDERARLETWGRRITDRNGKLAKREKNLERSLAALAEKQKVRDDERKQIRVERRALEDLRLQTAYDRAADPDDDEPDMTQLTLLPDYLAPELASLRRTIREMQAWDEQETAEIWAAMLRAVTSIEQQGREAFERKQELRAMWTVRKAS
jgi:chromosome segregation ATPase